MGRKNKFCQLLNTILASTVLLGMISLIKSDPVYTDVETGQEYPEKTILIGHIVYMGLHMMISCIGLMAYHQSKELDSFRISLLIYNGVFLIMDIVMMVLNVIFYKGHWNSMWWDDTVPIIYFFEYLLLLPLVFIVRHYFVQSDGYEF